MQRQMSFLETLPPGRATVWAMLDDEQRAEVKATLARLIAKVATAPRLVDDVGGEGADDE